MVDGEAEMKLRVLDLFSGIGGFSLGLERTGGFETVAFCEIEPFPRRVLAKHWPEVPCYEDVRTLTGARLAADGIAGIDVITGGFPCQDLSVAGRRAGLGEGTRSGLWSEIVRLIGELRPRYVIVENVANLLSGPSERRGGWFGRVLGDLAEIGFDAVWDCLPAGNLGAPHERDRVWLVAYSSGQGLEGLRSAFGNAPEIPDLGCNIARANAAKIQRLHGIQHNWLCAEPDRVADWPAWGGQQWPETEPLLCRVDDGLPDRVGRTAACGNAVVPQIPELIGRAILEAEAQKNTPTEAGAVREEPCITRQGREGERGHATSRRLQSC